MTENRRLAAILAADVVGYSKMMGEDEAGTLSLVRSLRSDLIEPKIAEHKGRLFKTMGDGFLAEFPSVVNAVACAAAIQKVMVARETNLSSDRAIQLRIGIHLGDIISEGDDVFGDGVNVAARIEGLAPPGGVAVSAMVHDNVGSRLDLTFEDMGECELKNIARPVRVYQLTTSAQSVALLANVQRTRPSIAVLPFVNMGGGAEEEGFADGVSEDIITALSRYSELLVIARTSSFVFKGQVKDVKAIAKQLNVRYILEGSVRRSGTRVRITAQLIDAADGQHIWAEKYDGSVDDVFDIQDQVTSSVAAATHTELLLTSWGTREQSPKGNPRAWELAGQAYRKAYEQTRDSIREANLLAEQALAIEPTNIRALRVASVAISSGVSFGLYPATPEYLEKAIALAEAAILASRRDEISRWVYSWALANAGRDHDSLKQLELAIEINPSYSLGYADIAERYVSFGEVDKAIAAAEYALRLNPLDPSNFWRYSCLAAAYLVDMRYELALENARRTVHENQDFPRGWLYLAAGLAALQKPEDARKAISRCLALVPDLRLSNVFVTHAHRFVSEEVRGRLTNILREAGLPD